MVAELTPRPEAWTMASLPTAPPVRSETLLPSHRKPSQPNEVHVLLRRANVPPATAVAIRVGSRAQSQIRPPLPVAQVVRAAVPGERPVRDLVVLVAGRGQHR